MLSYVITQRKREFGIRIALGAGKTCIIGMVFRKSLALVIAGCVLGTLFALGVAKLLSHFTNKVEFFDASGYAMGILLVIGAALAASWIPTRRAVKFNPAEILHCD